MKGTKQNLTFKVLSWIADKIYKLREYHLPKLNDYLDRKAGEQYRL